MNYYRLYFRKGTDGPMVRVAEIQANSDDEACDTANLHVGELALELWCGSRRVDCYDPDALWSGISVVAA